MRNKFQIGILIVVLLGMVSGTTGKVLQDGFNNGDFTNNPFWTESSRSSANLGGTLILLLYDKTRTGQEVTV